MAKASTASLSRVVRGVFHASHEAKATSSLDPMALGIELPDDLVHCLATEARLTGNLSAGKVPSAARTYGVKDLGFDRRHPSWCLWVPQLDQ